jgi:hypothetical protein
MPGQEIFAPMLAMFVLTFVVWVYLYAKRIPFILNSDLSDADMTPLAFMQRTPPDVANPSDNFKNLFEIPVLFYALCVYLFVTHQVDTVYVVAAWTFFVFRALHSLMHCTLNIVMVRFWLYFVATITCWYMLFRALVTMWAP